MAVVIIAGLTVAGCGGSATQSSTGASGSQPQGSSTTRHTTSRESESVPTESMEVSVPTALREGEGFISKRYTCDGADMPLPVRWSGTPSGTAELAIFVVNLQPIHGRLFFDWAVAGISATSHGISASRLPPGAIVGRNSFGNVGYSICPAKGTGEEHYVVRVVALPRPLAASPGFDAEAVYREAERSAKVVGLGGGAYKPPRA